MQMIYSRGIHIRFREKEHDKWAYELSQVLKNLAHALREIPSTEKF